MPENLTLDAIRSDAPAVSASSTTSSTIPEKPKYEVKEIEEIREPEPIDNSTYLDVVLGKTDAAIERTKKELYEKAVEQAVQKEVDSEDEVDSDVTGYAIASNNEPSNISSIDDILADESFDKEQRELFDEASEDYIVPARAVEVKETVAVQEKTAVAATVSEDNTQKVSSDSKEEKLTSENSIKRTFIDADELDELDEDDADDENPEDEERQKKSLEELKTELDVIIKPVKNAVDLSLFTISKKPTNISRLISTHSINTKKSADWVMYSAKKPMSMTELSGPELEKMADRNGRSRINMYKDIYSIFYSHVEDANKFGTLEGWVKTLNFFDISHLYFLAYRACYSGSNVLTYECPKCNKIHVVIKDIEDMVKYDSTEIEKEVKSILCGDTTTEKQTYEPILKQVSDDIAIGFRLPTVFSVVFESAILDDKWTRKFSDILGVISYIDAIYRINTETQQLEEIDYNPVPNNFEKTVKRKITTYNNILSMLSPDQYLNVLGELKKMNDKFDKISYVKPSYTCLDCGAVKEEELVDPQDLLFQRHQLQAIQNI